MAALSLKRAYMQRNASATRMLDEMSRAKRQCLKRTTDFLVKRFEAQSDDGNSDDVKDFNNEDSGFGTSLLDIRKSLSALSVPMTDYKMSRAIAQYSDDDETDLEVSEKHRRNSRRKRSNSKEHRAHSFTENSDCPFTASPEYSGHDLNVRGLSFDESMRDDKKLNHRRSSSFMSCLPTSPLSFDTYTVPSCSHVSVCHNGIPSSDFDARSRCFDYLVGAIDEAWARYCDSTSHDEEIAYGFENEKSIDDSSVSHSFMQISRPHDHNEQLKGKVNHDDGSISSANSSVCSSDEGNLTSSTFITDYDSDSNVQRSRLANKVAAAGLRSHCRVSEVPENMRLQKLKDRFIKAKYYLQDYVDSEEPEDCFLFWKKWDLVKYSAIELVEDTDNDDKIEKALEELEAGRDATSYEM